MSEPEQSWEDRFWQLICDIYRVFGGDCDDLPRPPSMRQTIDLVVARYADDGNPTFDTEAERAAFLVTLDEMDAHLALPGNSLTQESTEIVTTLVADLRTGATAGS